MKAHFEGEVVKKPYATGSKSEGERVYLQVTPTQKYALRHLGGNPFRDDTLETLVGKRLRVSGEIAAGDTLIMNDYQEL